MTLPDLPAGIPRNLAYADGRLSILDQTRLPGDLVTIRADNLETVAEAIRELRVRGAPAIGVAAAYGLCVALGARLRGGSSCRPGEAGELLRSARVVLAATRPTAVNLKAALVQMLDAGDSPLSRELDAVSLLAALERRALDWHLDDARRCEAIAAAGLTMLPRQARLLTHCNAGPLATGGIGTALGVILRGHAEGWRFSIHADETRPLLQGARLTAWELQRAGVPVTLQADGAAASLILGGSVDAVIVGADRIAVNGDTANKVGTLPLALACARAGLPFYVAAPLSTLDRELDEGSGIPIEERDGHELSHWDGVPVAPPGVGLRNPAFDVTPGDLVTAFFTEGGVLHPPYGPNRWPV
jgi:methylthioribose-1-phosphate isomerase